MNATAKSENSMTKIGKREYVLKLATFLRDSGMTMSGRELADHLNRNWDSFTSPISYKYAGMRGTYSMIESTYNWAKARGYDCEAIAEAFVKPDGKPAWEKK